MGTPWIIRPGVVAYEVKGNRKTFGISLQSQEFDGWAADGRKVAGTAEFPSLPSPINFVRTFTSGRELTFNDRPEMLNAHNKCQPGEVIEFYFDDGGPPLPDAARAASEGEQKLVIHRIRERSSALAREIRDNANGICSYCETDLSTEYGEIGPKIIEAHHREPLSTGTRISDESSLVALCPNCHRAVHAWMRMNPEAVKTDKEMRKIISQR